MIKIRTGTTTSRDEAVIVPANTVIRDLLADHGYDPDSGSFVLNSRSLSRDDLSKTLGEFPAPAGSEVWSLLDIVKARNA